MKTFVRRVLSVVICIVCVVVSTIPADCIAYAANTYDITRYSTGAAATHDCNTYRVVRSNSSQHWYECTFCGKKWNYQNHSLQTTGTYTCKDSVPPQHVGCTFAGCGYGYDLAKKPHTPITSYWVPLGEEDSRHYKLCSECHNWCASGDCTDRYGNLLGCNHAGTCVSCGAYHSGHHHHHHGETVSRSVRYSGHDAYNDGKLVCSRCKEDIGVTYSSHTWKESETTNGFQCWMYNPYYRFIDSSSVTAYDASFDELANIRILEHYVYEDGHRFYISGYVDFNTSMKKSHRALFCEPSLEPETYRGTVFNGNIEFCPDWDAPSYSSSSVSYGSKVNNIATSVTIDAKYYDNIADQVQIRLLDSNGSVVCGYTNAVKSGKYFTCRFTPAVEFTGNRTFYIQAKDGTGNESGRTAVNLVPVDSKAPVASELSTGNNWTKTKTIRVSCTDTGSGNVQIALNTPSDYKAATKSGNTYYRDIVITGDLYGSLPLMVLYKDAAGNTSSKKLTTYYLDNTVPSLSTSVTNGNNVSSVKMTAGDRNGSLGRDGSGIANDGKAKHGFYYGYSSTNNVNSAKWSSLATASTYTVSNLTGGTYYFWVKDYAGNVSGSKAATVLPTFNISYQGNGNTSGSTSAQTKTFGTDISLRSNGFGRTGYTFVGWNTKADGKGTSYAAGAKYTSNANLTLYAQWRPNTYKVRYNGNGATSGSMADSDHVYDVYKTLTPNSFVRSYLVTYNPVLGNVDRASDRVGYAYAGWNTNAGGTGTSYADRANVRNLTAANNGVFNLYAVWNRRSAVLPTPNRTGWTFVAWYDGLSGGTLAGEGNTAYYPTKNITLFARWKRKFTLILSSSAYETVGTKSFAQEIFSPALKFVYDDNISGKFTPYSTRKTKDASYRIVFKGNDVTNADGTVSHTTLYGYTPTAMSTELKDGVIIAYPQFRGWHSKPRNVDGTAAAGDVLIGNSGTTAIITPEEGSSTSYTIDCGNIHTKFSSPDTARSLTLYPHWSAATIVLPDATRHSEKQEYVDDPVTGGRLYTGQKEDLFLGWFTEEQPEDGSAGFGGTYIGKAGDVVEVTDHMTLYPWFNVAPELSESPMVGLLRDRYLPDGFFEGQHVSYDQLLSFVDASDTDDPSEVYGNDVEWSGAVNYNNLTLIQKLRDLYNMSAAAYLKAVSDERELGLSNDDIWDIVSRVNASVSDSNQFVPRVTGITYYGDGLDPSGNRYPAADEDVVYDQPAASVQSDGLLSGSDKVGRVVLHYQITDNGSFADGVKILEGNSIDGVPFDYDSMIDVNLDIVTSVNYNHAPVLTLRSTYLYSGDEDLTSSSVGRFLWQKQKASDVEDETDMMPWWYASEAFSALQDNICVVRVYDINFSSSYYIDHKDRCEEIQAVRSLDKLFEWKDKDYDAFSHITDFKLEWDCVDQWGKTASGYVMPGFNYEHDSGYDISNLTSWSQGNGRDSLPAFPDEDRMSTVDRSSLVIMVNNKDDIGDDGESYVENMRYIDQSWLDYMDSDSYWGSSDYGKNKLLEIFNKYNVRNGGNLVRGSYGDNGSVQVEVNDYTD